MTARPLFTLVAFALVAACGGEASRADTTEGTNAGAEASATRTSDEGSSAGDASPSDAAPGPASNDRCAEARFEDTQPFAFHDDLPFRFEVPAGWDHLDSSNSAQLVGSVAYLGRNGRRSSTGLIQYVFGRDVVSSPDVMLDMYRQSMEQIGTVTIGGEEVEVFGHGDPGVINAKFLIPDRGGLRQVSFIFGAASDACLPERRRIRELVLGSVADRS